MTLKSHGKDWKHEIKLHLKSNTTTLINSTLFNEFKRISTNAERLTLHANLTNYTLSLPALCLIHTALLRAKKQVQTTID